MRGPESSRRISTLELRVCRQGAGWQRYGIYAPSEQADAMETARALERDSTVAAVKLIKESFDPEGDDGTTTVTLFRSASLAVENGSKAAWAGAVAAGDAGRILQRGTGDAVPRTPASGSGGLFEQLRQLVARLVALSPSLFSMGGGLRAGVADPDRDGRPTAPDPGPPVPAGPPPSRWPQELGLVWTFLDDARARLEHFRRVRDNFGLFGVCFFLAGACAVIQDESGMTADDGSDFLVDCLALVGLTPQRARIFADRSSQYLLENERYLAMFQAGVAALSAFRSDGVTGASSLAAALARWTEPPSGAGSAGRRLTLMFTDIVGSTTLAAEHGDAAAIRIIRIHNQIVEAVLHQLGGLHVKNLGDGTLAVFDTAASGLRAAVIIQRCISEHNRHLPAHAFQLRIGLNVGPAIVEAGDLIGATVNLASRVCQAAGPAEILCTAALRDAVGGTTLTLTEWGMHAIKGYRQPIMLYRVAWQEGGPAVPVASDAAAPSPRHQPRASAGAPATAA
ncbi:MAG: adenylate/guanylate cyclase domain-containing protein [Rhodospirillales bacterium]|nr:MAG: adenylate/guanylate cyclase domain-containing protein [Rhodospirillales bacterium]